MFTLANTFGKSTEAKFPSASITAANVSEVIGVDSYVKDEKLKVMAATDPKLYLHIRSGVLSLATTGVSDLYTDFVKSIGVLQYNENTGIVSNVDNADAMLQAPDTILTARVITADNKPVFNAQDVKQLAAEAAEAQFMGIKDAIDMEFPAELTKVATENAIKVVNAENGIGKL